MNHFKCALSQRDQRYILAWSKKIRAVRLLGGKCTKCGTDNVFVLDFHHCIGHKEYKISMMRENRWSEIEKEIKKCVLLCKNCHQESHGSDTNLYKNKLLEAKGVKECLRCGYNKCLTSLDFHHRNRKTKKIAISSACRKHGFLASIDNMLKEIEKCDVICRNCHAIEHTNTDRYNRLKTAIYNKIKNYKEQPMVIDKNKVINLFKMGNKSCKIAKEMGCANSTISLLLKRNGIKVNHDIEAFSIVCPVCEKTFRVNGKYNKDHRRFCSRKCRGIGYRGLRRSRWPTKRKLDLEIKESSWEFLGRKYNVTGNAIKYWAKSYGLI